MTSPPLPPLYLDYAATTPVAPEVLEAMLPYFRDAFANPSSIHRLGQRARRAVETAREQVAAAINASPKEIVFTSGATEAANLGLVGVAEQLPGRTLLTSMLEHPAVGRTLAGLSLRGWPVRHLRSDPTGAITPGQVADALDDEVGGEVGLVALMLVNNETGIRTDVAAIAREARRRGALVACDAVQAFGCEPIDVRELDVDLLFLSGHKIYGPKGVGVLYLREGLELEPLLRGGSQERGRRPGTHNVPAIVGMGVAAERAARRASMNREQLARLRDAFEARLLELPGVSVNGAEAPRGPKHSNVRFAGADNQALLMAFDAVGVYASAGSACSAGSVEPSRVLLAMGLGPDEARASVRFSFGEGVTIEQVADAADRVAAVLERQRASAPKVR